MSSLQYTELPERAAKAIEGFLPSEVKVAERTQKFANTPPRPADKEGDTEVLDGVTFTHHFISVSKRAS